MAKRDQMYNNLYCNSKLLVAGDWMGPSFTEFMDSAQKYAPLKFNTQNSSSPSKRIILIDETLGKNMLNSLLAYTQPASHYKPPLIIITNKDDPYQISDHTTLTYRDLLPITKHPACTSIELNPLTTKNITSILKANTNNGEVESVAEMSHGDLRLALNSIQFGANDGCNSRDNALDLFHALGQILYRKRILMRLAKLIGDHAQKLIHPPAKVLQSLPVDERLFAKYIFANYANFCGSLEESACAAEWLSQADVLDSTLLACTGFLEANKNALPPKKQKFSGIDS